MTARDLFGPVKEALEKIVCPGCLRDTAPCSPTCDSALYALCALAAIEERAEERIALYRGERFADITSDTEHGLKSAATKRQWFPKTWAAGIRRGFRSHPVAVIPLHEGG